MQTREKIAEGLENITTSLQRQLWLIQVVVSLFLFDFYVIRERRNKVRGPCGAAAAPQPLVLFGGWGMSQYFTSSAPNSLVFFFTNLGFWFSKEWHFEMFLNIALDFQ